jgi:hypothetical protein
MSNTRAIHGALSGIQNAFRRLLGRGLGAWYAAAVLFAVGLSMLFAQAGWPRLGIGSVALTLVGGGVTAVWLFRRFDPAARLAAAELVEQLAPELGSSPTSAISLEPLRQTTFSDDLIDLHLERTAEALGGVNLEERLARQHQKPRRVTLAVLSICGLWTLLLVLLLDGGRTRLASLLLDPTAARMSDVPLTGDIQLTYHYPAYTGLESRVVEGDGSITAVVGTEVEVAAIADIEVDRGSLRITSAGEERALPLEVRRSRNLATRLTVMRDGSYRFAFVDGDGDRVEERLSHPIRATLDAHPEIHIDSPAGDVELKDDQTLDILWRARDDFGVGEVALVVEQQGVHEPQRIELATVDRAETRREGRYRWSTSEIALAPGTEARFYLEAFDNDAIHGPKRAVSRTRRISLFSARKHHEDLLAHQREILDSLVDWLADDLEAPFPAAGGDAAIHAQRAVLGRITTLQQALGELVAALGADKLTPPEIVNAFANVRDHVNDTRSQRSRDLTIASRPLAKRSAFMRLGQQQGQQIVRLEGDIIYLDDLLALQRIDELKHTAQDLLAAQRDLQQLLTQYRDTQDPALRAMLGQQIRELRQKMLELMQKMAHIKEGLPGEYRNLEAANMVRLDNQLDRLEQMLREGDLDAAARELEQLAGMLENMVNSIDQAEREFGGERYAELRRELAEFAQEFRELEDQQRALAERTDELVGEYRKQAMEQAGRNLDAFVKKARATAAEALEKLDAVAESRAVARHTQDDVARARERLLDADALLESRDFAEAQNAAAEAEHHAEGVEGMLEHQMRWGGGRSPAELDDAQRASKEALQRTRELHDMLNRLFPRPEEVLPPERLAQMQRMRAKQQNLEQQAGELGKKMENLSQEMPLFGGEPKRSLDSAETEMGQAAGDMGEGNLPGAAQHKRRAVEELGKLRQSLEQASQGGQGGLPLPLGGLAGGGRRPGGGSSGFDNQSVEIPAADKNRADPRFRKDLLEAAKQKAPDHYQEAVRQYYEELIR